MAVTNDCESLHAPQMLLAEYSVIGCLLLDPRLSAQLLHQARADDFTVPELRRVFEAATMLMREGKPIDAVTLRAACGAEYNDLLMGCMDITPPGLDISAYISQMQAETRLSRLNEIGARLSSCTIPADAPALVEQATEVLATHEQAKVVTMVDALVDFYNAQEQKRSHIRYGFDKIDANVFSDYGDFVILAGRPSSGKTALALQMAANMAEIDRVGFYSLETTPQKLMARLVASLSFVDFGTINRRKLTENDYAEIASRTKQIERLQLEMISASGWTVSQILACAMAQRHKIVIIDYLQLIRPPKTARDRVQAVTEISMALHEMAQAHGIFVIALSQFSRAPTARCGAEPQLSDLRESGQIEQDADVVMALYQRDEDERTQIEDRCLAVLKNKEGRLGKFTLAFDGSHQAFFEYFDGQRAVIKQCNRMQKKGAQNENRTDS